MKEKEREAAEAASVGYDMGVTRVALREAVRLDDLARPAHPRPPAARLDTRVRLQAEPAARELRDDARDVARVLAGRCDATSTTITTGRKSEAGHTVRKEARTSAWVDGDGDGRGEGTDVDAAVLSALEGREAERAELACDVQR